MGKFGEKYVVLSLAEFETLLKVGRTYTGLVESIGYVFWSTEEIYFVRTNPQERFAKPIYKQILFPYHYRSQGVSIESKISYRLNVMAKEDLKRFCYDMYLQFYGIKELQQTRQDKTAVYNPNREYISQLRPRYSGNSSPEEKMWKAFDNTTDALDCAGAIELPKWFAIGKTAITIIHDLTEGEYLSAAGTLILSISKYGFLIDVGSSVVNSDYMQEGVASAYARNYKDAEINYKRASYFHDRAKDKHDYRTMQKYDEEMRKYGNQMQFYRNEFEKCINRLGVKY